MKSCPVCKGRVFDDMDTCYNCLHHFENDCVQNENCSSFDDYDDIGFYGMSEVDCSPQWNMPKEENSIFKDYISKYCVFLNNYVKNLS